MQTNWQLIEKLSAIEQLSTRIVARGQKEMRTITLRIRYVVRRCLLIFHN